MAIAIGNSFSVQQHVAMCSMEWEGNSDVWLFPPCGCYCWQVVGAMEKDGRNRVVWSLGAAQGGEGQPLS